MKEFLIFIILLFTGCTVDDQSSYKVTIQPSYDFDITPLQQGLKLFGEYERVGTKSNSWLDDMVKRFYPQGDVKTTPWCSAFINEATLATGYESSMSLSARSWAKIGESCLGHERPGDIAVLWRESKSSWKGHVAFFIRYNENKSEVLLYGGNQGNRVTFMWYDASRILDVRRVKQVRNQIDSASYNQITLE